MIKNPGSIILVIIILLMPVSTFAAGAAKFMYISSIYSDNKDVGLKHPEGIACNESLQVIVADTGNGRLVRYNLNDETPGAEGEIRITQLSYPTKVLFNSRGEIAALDGKNQRIVRLNSEGQFIGYIDPAGLTSPYIPRSFAFDSDNNIYILDIFSERVIILSPEGTFKQSIKFPENYGFFSDITVDFKGTILLVDSVNAKVFSFDGNLNLFIPLTDSLKKYMRFPTNITTDNRGRIYLVDHNGSLISVIGQDGSYLGQLSGMGWKEGLLNYPSQLCINSKEEVFVADTNNSRVQIFKLVK